jgi:hypothetical protein
MSSFPFSWEHVGCPADNVTSFMSPGSIPANRQLYLPTIKSLLSKIPEDGSRTSSFPPAESLPIQHVVARLPILDRSNFAPSHQSQETAQDTIHVAIDMSTGSREADRKRKRNARASADHRQRTKKRADALLRQLSIDMEGLQYELNRLREEVSLLKHGNRTNLVSWQGASVDSTKTCLVLRCPHRRRENGTQLHQYAHSSGTYSARMILLNKIVRGKVAFENAEKELLLENLSILNYTSLFLFFLLLLQLTFVKVTR